jgi:hypothetical protein
LVLLCAVRRNSSKFLQQISKAAKQEIISQNTIKPEISEMEARASMELCELAICCKTGGQLGCIQKPTSFIDFKVFIYNKNYL